MWNHLSPKIKDTDVKLQRIQNLLAKAACPSLYLLDFFISKSTKQEGMTKQEVKSHMTTCNDTYQFLQATFTDITFRRRAIIKTEIQDKYKVLCDDSTLVTEWLFGNDMKEKVKELDAEHNICKKTRQICN